MLSYVIFVALVYVVATALAFNFTPRPANTWNPRVISESLDYGIVLGNVDGKEFDLVELEEGVADCLTGC